jgi:hypothetical protein
MPLTADDKIEIQELLARYCLTADSGDDAWADLFAPDGQWLAQTARLRKPEEFRAHIAAYRERPTMQKTKHRMTNIVIEELDDAGDRARVVSDVMNIRIDQDGPKITFIGMYEDVVKKVDGRWLFELRKMSRENILYVDHGIEELFTTDE